MTLFVGDPSAPTRFGTDVNDTTDPKGLFLKQFGGEVFTAFAESTIMMDKHFVRSISQGKSAQFPRTWKVDSEYHTAGQEMLGQDTDQTEKVISVDGLLVSHVAIYDLDDKMSHFDVSSIYSRELGLALGRTFDKNVMRQVLLAARESITSPFPSGKQITNSDIDSSDSADLTGTGAGTRGLAMWRALRQARLELLDKNVPETTPVWAAVSPTVFDELKWTVDGNGNYVVANRDFANQTVNATNPMQEMIEVEGIRVLRSNLIPDTDESSDTNVLSKYRGDYSSTLSLVWIPESVGTVKLINMGLEMERDARRQEDFMVAKLAVGHGSLRNEGAIEIQAAA